MNSAITRAPAGAVLFRPNDACDCFIVVRKGAIRVSMTGVGGREIVLYRVTPGEICLQWRSSQGAGWIRPR